MRGRRSGGLEIYRGGNIQVGMDAPGASLPSLATRVDPAWGRLGRLAAETGLIVSDILGREYAREQTARVDDAVLEAAKSFELWKAEWNGRNQGREGVNALAAYQEAYGKICDETLKNFDGAENEIFADLLRRRLAERGLSAIREGAGYAHLSRQNWMNSQWQAQLEDFQAYVAANPEDGQGIAFRKNSLMQSWRAKNPGLEPGAADAQLNGMEFKQRMEGFLASGDAAGARAYLAGYSRMAGLSREDSLSSWLLAHNNPGSVTVDGYNFAAYETPRDGLKAVMGRLAAYHRRGKKSIRAMINTYAPPSENDTAGYVRHMAACTGMDPDREVDIGDRQVLARLAGAILVREHSRAAPEEELLAAADDFLKNGEPRAAGVIRRKKSERNFLPGLDPAAFRQYGERIKALEAGQQSEADLARTREILADVQKLPIARRDQEILRIIQEMPAEEAERMRPLLKRGVQERKDLDHLAQSFALRDAFTASLKKMPNAPEESLLALAMKMSDDIAEPDMREEFKQFALQEIKNRKDSLAAREAEQVRLFMQGQQGKSPAEIQQALAASSLSPQARARAAQLSWGLARDENPANLRAASLALMLRDQGALNSEYEIEAFAAQNGLTLSQVKQIRDYKGKAANVSISRVNNLLKNLSSLGGFAGPEQIDAQGYRILLEQLKPGQEPSDQDLLNLLAKLYLSHGSWFWKETVMDELAKEQFNMDWFPDIPPWQERELEQELALHNIKASLSNKRALLKLKLFQDMGWKIDREPEWEK